MAEVLPFPVTPEPGPAPVYPDPLPVPDPPEPREIAILFDDSSPEYAEVARQLAELLPAEYYRPTIADIGADDSQELLGEFAPQDDLITVAIGLPSAQLARDELAGPLLFALVFNYHELLDDQRPIRGVAAMPPLELQLREWKRFDTGLERMGVILSEEHAALLSQAEYAADSSGMTLRHEISASNQETLYLFRRLASQIDGFWLVPDDRILSPGVVRELLSYAVAHGVRVSVFSNTLLEWGALQSASPTPTDVAQTLRRVIERMVINGADDVADLTPLSEFEVRINPQVAEHLHLEVPPRTSWIVW